MASSYSMTSKTQTEAKQAEEKRVVERRRAALVLCIRHLVDHGYIEAAEKLQSESRISLQEHDAADNVDLLAIIQEYEFFFEMKFGKKPKLTKKTTADSATLPKLPPSGRSAAAAAAAAAGGGSKQRRAVDDSSGDEKNPKSSLSTGLAGLGASRAAASSGAAGEGGDGFGLVGTALKGNAVGAAKKSSDDPNDFFKERLLKPLPDFGGNSELRELAGSLQRDIWTSNPDVRWSDVAAADNAKRLLKEAVVMPSRYPQLFTGLLKPWKGVLLFGPPGTGKTMLAKAVATECRTTFFNISASSIVSKWRGDSEKLVRALFELARHHAPSTIFVDEIDSIMSSRDGGGQEHEGSRRMKTELLIQMDGLTASNDQVFLLAASNLPWDLDTALLRRLEKRIYVGLPPTSARLLIMNKHLHDRVEKGYSLESMAAATEGYSGSDVVLLCKEAAMRPLRRLMKRIEDNEALGALTGEVVLEPISSSDMEQAVRASRPSCRVDESQYLKWHDDFGAAM